ncbi:hypothetical protein B0H11DRAFT_1907375 [Mycena galericulata]|nr:hypothetical protein B0H11DRAFT_1907375 [Mycena galericulata]
MSVNVLANSTIVGDDVNNNAGTIFMPTDSRDKLVVKAEPGDRLTPRLRSPDIKKVLCIRPYRLEGALRAWHSSSPSPGPSKALCRARLGLTKPRPGSARLAGLGRALDITTLVLSNYNFLGPIPAESRDLTVIEEAIIGRPNPRRELVTHVIITCHICAGWNGVPPRPPSSCLTACPSHLPWKWGVAGAGPDGWGFPPQTPTAARS